MTNQNDTKPSPASVHRSHSLMQACATGSVAARISQFEEAARENDQNDREKDKENARPGATPGRAKGKKRQTLATHQEEPLGSPGQTTPKKAATPNREPSLLRSALRGSPFRARTPARLVPPSLPATPEDVNNGSKTSDSSDPFSFIPKSSPTSLLQGNPQLNRVDSSQSETKSSPFGSFSSRLAGLRSRFSPANNSGAKANSLNEDIEIPLAIPVKDTADTSASKVPPFARGNTGSDIPPPTPIKTELPIRGLDSTPSKPSSLSRFNDTPSSPVARRPELTTSVSDNTTQKPTWLTRTNDNQLASSFSTRPGLTTRASDDTPSKSRLTKFQDNTDPPSPTPVDNKFTTGRFDFLTSKFSQFSRGNNDVEPPSPIRAQHTTALNPSDTSTISQHRSAKQEADMAEGTTPEGGFVVPRLADILRTPEDLDKIPALKAEYERKKAAVDAQLREGLREQLESVQRGMAALAEGQRQVAKTRDELQNIDKLCRESQTTVGDFAQIDKLAKINRNFEAVIMMKKRLEEFPSDLAEVERLLREDDEDMENQPNLLPAHMSVSHLRDFRDEAMEQIRRAKDKDYENQLIELFQDLDPTIEWFEEHIGTLCMNLIPLIQEGKNGVVTRLAVVIRKEEVNDEQVRALQEAQKDHKGLATRFRSMNIGPKTVRGYKENLLKSIELYAQNQFEETKEKFLGDPDKLPKYFRWFFNDLMAVQQGMQRCMPKKWKIYKTYTNIYHKLMHDWLLEFIDDPQLPAANMLAIVHWVEKYYEKMAKLGWNQADLVPHVVDERESELVRDWRNLIVKALDEWMDRMFNTDKNSFLERDADALDTNADGYFRTKTLGDMWRMIHEQLMAAGASERTDVAEGVVDAMFRALKHRQSVWQSILDEECAKYKTPAAEQSEGLQQLQDWLIAIANDQIACIDDNDASGSLGYLTRFRRDLEPLVTEKYLASRVEAEIESLRDGYVDLSTYCITRFIDLIFSVDFRTTLPDFFTQKWYGEFAMKRMITTFEDYMADYNDALHPSLRDILIEEISDELLVHYLSAIRNKGAKFRRQDPFTDKFKDDVLTIFAFFQQFPDAFQVEGGVKDRWRLVDWLVRLLEAEKGPGVVAVYEAFKTEYWDLQISWVEAVLRARDDFERSMVSAVKAKSAELNVERGPESIMGRVR